MYEVLQPLQEAPSHDIICKTLAVIFADFVFFAKIQEISSSNPWN